MLELVDLRQWTRSDLQLPGVSCFLIASGRFCCRNCVQIAPASVEYTRSGFQLHLACKTLLLSAVLVLLLTK